MSFDILDVILIMAIVQCSIFFVFLLQRNHRKRANLFLALFFVSQIFACFNIFFLHHQIELVFSHSYLFFIGTPFYFIIGPSLFLYTKSVAFSNYRFTVSDLKHFMFFIIALIFYIIAFHIKSIETKRILIQSNIFRNSIFFVIYNHILFIQIAGYIIASLLVIRKYRNLIKQEYSYTHTHNLSWLKLFLFGYLIAWITSLLYIINVFIYSNSSLTLQVVNNLFFFTFFNLIFYKGLIQPEIFSGIEEKTKYLTSKLSKSDADNYAVLLSSYMESKKPYLNPTISLMELSNLLSIPSRFLSQVINEYYHKNFFDFINQYRIEEAKIMLHDPAYKNKTVLEILYDVGFNSKSSFNAVFKKKVGITPRQFRESNRL
jgi:AraC-like DNA-binding protein